MTEKQIEECEKKFLSKESYYKITLRHVLMSLGIITVIVITVIGWSYKPIKDIAVLKNEVTTITKKLDKALKRQTNTKTLVLTQGKPICQ